MADRQLQVQIDGLTSQGPFSLIAGVNDMSVDLMNQGLPGVPETGGSAVPTTVTVVSSTGKQGPPGQQGIPGSAGATLREVEPEFDGLYACDLVAETLADEDLGDFDSLASGTRTVSFVFYGKAASGATGTVKLRIAGASGAVDGTVIATAIVTGAAYSAYKVTGTFTNPTGRCPIKMTISSSIDGQDVTLKEVSASLS